MALCSIAIAAGVVGMVAVLKRFVFRRHFGHFAHAGGACGGGRWRRWGHGDHGRGLGRSFWLRALFARLDTTPGQEREIRAAIEDLRDRARDAKSGLFESRENLGKAMVGETFDVGAFEAASARVDATSEKVKDAVRSALEKIHGVLDPKQRERLAEIVSTGGFGRFRRSGGGPYRGTDL